jgi:hypothetical protein
MTHLRHSDTWKNAIAKDIGVVGGQDAAACLLQVTQGFISRCINPYKKDSLKEAELFALLDAVKELGKVPECVRFLMKKYAPMEEINSIEEDVKQLSATIHRVKSKTLNLQEGMRA